LRVANIVFITGTDTGVGKTVLTALLVRHCREEGWDARAMKPFCSGSRADARFLRAAQEKVLTLEEVNPFYFPEPVAPAAARRGPKNIRLDDVAGRIRRVAMGCDVLFVEGSGGLWVPLGANYAVADLVKELKCPTLVVGRNSLGTINHTVLAVNALEVIGVEDVAVVLMGQGKSDLSAKTNARMIRRMLPGTAVTEVQNLGKGASRTRELKNNVKYLKKTLARILKDDIFTSFSG
jgi:dethiobiotin synthetase